MANKIIPKALFYVSIIAVAFAAGLLYHKNAPKAEIAPAVQDAGSASPAVAQTQPSPSGTSANAPAPANANGAPKSQPAQPPSKPTCIITIDGLKYDVQPLRSTHPGGDVFRCGADMSAVFHGQHGDNLGMIRPYLVK